MTHTAQLNGSGNIGAGNCITTALDQAKTTPPQFALQIIQICFRWKRDT
jgi:hypothetical protein